MIDRGAEGPDDDDAATEILGESDAVSTHETEADDDP